MAMSWKGSSHALNENEIEYINKVEWLWNHLSLMQRGKIESSVNSNILKQENSKHCFIGEAMCPMEITTVSHDNLFVDIFMGFGKIIFYDGPSYGCLLGRKVTREEKHILDDIYYAKIGNAEHQYKQANKLIRFYMFNRITIR